MGLRRDMGSVRSGRFAVAVLLAMPLTWVGALSLSAPQGNEGDATRLHASGAALEEGALSVIRALLREDLEGGRLAMDGLVRSSRRLGPDDEAIFGSSILAYDRAFHATLDKSRELAAAGEATDAFDQFVWVLRSCRICHGLARERGLLPPLATGPKEP